MKIFLSSSHFGTIFSHTHIFQHHLNSHHITPQIRWLLFTFPWKLQARPRLRTFFRFFQVGIPMHVTLIDKWSFWDGFWKHLRLFSPWRFNEWIPLVVPTLFLYRIRSHSTLNCMCPWSGLPLSRDQAFKWKLSHCRKGNIVLIHKPHFLFSILWNFWNTFFRTPI
jgi:hypothetical protein